MLEGVILHELEPDPDTPADVEPDPVKAQVEQAKKLAAE